MKKLIGFIILVVVAAGIYTAAGPYIALYQIRAGVEDSDSETISRYVDFPKLRTNLKDQFRGYVRGEDPPNDDKNLLSRAAKGLASKVAEGMVDTFVTPDGLVKLIQGKQRNEDGNSGSPSGSKGRGKDPFQDAHCHYDSLSTFSVRIKDDRSREIQLILTRDGLSWKLTNIILPLNK